MASVPVTCISILVGGQKFNIPLDEKENIESKATFEQTMNQVVQLLNVEDDMSSPSISEMSSPIESKILNLSLFNCDDSLALSIDCTFPCMDDFDLSAMSFANREEFEPDFNIYS